MLRQLPSSYFVGMLVATLFFGVSFVRADIFPPFVVASGVVGACLLHFLEVLWISPRN